MTKFQREQTKQSILYMCRLTFKTLTICLAVTYGILYAFLAVKSAEAATLRTEAVIQSDVVRVSDIFQDTSKHGDVIVGNAPSPGQSVILNARTLQRMANLYNIDWVSNSPADQIVVRSLVQTVTSEDIIAAIKNDLVARGVTGKFDVSLSNHSPTMTLPAHVEPSAEVVQMSYTPGRDVFTAVVASPNAQNPIKTLSISGLIEKTTQIPVLKTSAKSGDIISSIDITWMDVPARHMLHDTITDADDLIGKTPVRMVDVNVPVRLRDVANPQLVARGDEILLQFNHGGLQLTAKGKAMQNGAEGDYIRVMNLSSNQSLRAEVIGSKLVAVQ